jgi:hypothetical protein
MSPENSSENLPTPELEQFFQVFGTQARIPHDALQDFGMEDFRAMEWNGCPFAFGIFVDHVAAALARD